MASSEYYRVHAKPRDDINHGTGVWINFLLEVDPSIQGSKMPSAHHLAIQTAHKIYGVGNLSLTFWEVHPDKFEKTLADSDYHVVASAAYSEDSLTPRTNLEIHTPLNGGEGVKIGICKSSGEYTVHSFKDFWTGYSLKTKNCTIITIKDR